MILHITASLGLMLFAGFASLGGLPFFFLMLIAMYFLLIAPNQRKQKQWQTMLSGIKVGDRITTTGGMRGTVTQVKDDVFTVRFAPDNLKFDVVKNAIASVTTEDAAA